ncbi:nicotinate-nucleotide--dimethylbenzimidazole phosphoribosyltransferase [Pseudodonghicola flavimaris]|uniref:Nicotinate-nucleotide--dimethylbenzimidazole phosphoribosyltransferase n=1 Tax=Pseudodonghicola flavimaris TaxID=3050036 RepID=A0ABT7F5P2_9RHOB|nr:nicotinate-nucleotide--dimethylbenzimidazole phosphoribosyltransferase [Pseudodonghicola flavimaris]MDK3019724.1 nicotinate-nucleotide--dimethylbenzimidazole phosphoribosyltransferase [Pseudodonghicola flavimaris]
MLADFQDLDSFRHLLAAAPAPDAAARSAAAERNGQLTKPPGALGRLEEIAIWYAGWRADPRPRLTAPQVIVFAGNHGVVAQGISAFPADVTVQMVANFQAGGAAVNQLAGAAGARMDVIALELDRPTADFTQGPAMTEAELLQALTCGWQAVDPATDLLVVGEMGIGNTTAAAALSLALFGGTAADWTGRGTGLDDAGLANKTRVVAEAVALHAPQIGDGLDALARLGGREIAAMAGAIAAARQLRIPVLLDGFICCAGAACLEKTVPGALDHTIAGHSSAEPGHARLLAALDKAPLLQLGLRLGEGSGAALAIPLIKGALACHSDMATFAEAGVSEG